MAKSKLKKASGYINYAVVAAVLIITSILGYGGYLDR